MKLKSKQKSSGRLSFSDVKKDTVVYCDKENNFSKQPLDKGPFLLIRKTGEVISYISDCGEEEGDDDLNCDVMGCQKWLVFDLDLGVETNMYIHFFLNRWFTIINNPVLYNRYMPPDIDNVNE